MVYVGDRESDMLNLLVCAHESEYAADYLLRSQHERSLSGSAKLWAEVLSTVPLGELRFVLPPRKGRKSRPIRQQLHTKRGKLSDRRGGELEATCVIATEIDPPAEETPIECGVC